MNLYKLIKYLIKQFTYPRSRLLKARNNVFKVEINDNDTYN